MSAPVLGLTGGIGCGKSAVASFFMEAGWELVDTDAIARALVVPHTPVWQQIYDYFGPEYFDDKGHLDRPKLASRVFACPDALAALNNMLHPPIRLVWQSRLRECAVAGQPAIVAIPLLFETGADTEFQKIAAVGCSPSVQRARLAARSWSPEQIQHRIAAQWNWSRKQAGAHFVLWNDGDLTLLRRQVQRLIGSLL
jgi:dephospho-CoA kinase